MNTNWKESDDSIDLILSSYSTLLLSKNVEAKKNVLKKLVSACKKVGPVSFSNRVLPCFTKIIYKEYESDNTFKSRFIETLPSIANMLLSSEEANDFTRQNCSEFIIKPLSSIMIGAVKGNPEEQTVAIKSFNEICIDCIDLLTFRKYVLPVIKEMFVENMKIDVKVIAMIKEHFLKYERDDSTWLFIGVDNCHYSEDKDVRDNSICILLLLMEECRKDELEDVIPLLNDYWKDPEWNIRKKAIKCFKNIIQYCDNDQIDTLYTIFMQGLGDVCYSLGIDTLD